MNWVLTLMREKWGETGAGILTCQRICANGIDFRRESSPIQPRLESPGNQRWQTQDILILGRS